MAQLCRRSGSARRSSALTPLSRCVSCSIGRKGIQSLVCILLTPAAPQFHPFFGPILMTLFAILAQTLRTPFCPPRIRLQER